MLHDNQKPEEKLQRYGVSYLPDRYLEHLYPSKDAYYPFSYEGVTSHIQFSEKEITPSLQSLESWIPEWMAQINAFPIYFCVVLPAYSEEEYKIKFDGLRATYQLSKGRRTSIFVVKARDEELFRKLLPIILSIGSNNDIALWSTRSHTFQVVEKELIYRKPRRKKKLTIETKATDYEMKVVLESNTSVFWVGHDADDLYLLSSDSHMTTYDRLRSTLPATVMTILEELSD
ncbi:hypothetical protein [Paenibacillus sp. Marseille-Q7038]